MNRDYKFIESTSSLCSDCIKKVDAKIIQKGNSIFLLKSCPEHGEQLNILEEDASWFLDRNQYTKPGTKSKTQTKINKGCPFDCGLCPQHDQHTCIGLIEVTNKCDLKCPVCYASSGEGEFLNLETIEKMMNLFQDSESGNAEVLQISGGEPTMHPEIIKILELAREKKFKYVMLNTNGMKLAKDEGFVKELAKFGDHFEIYLQFDGFEKTTYEHFRGKDLRKIKEKAIANLTKHKIPTTLVATIEKNVNDKEIVKIIEYALENEFIRGVNFQPVSFSGRVKNHNIKDRITLTGILNKIEQQTKSKIKKSDFIPLPCNVDRVAINYMYKHGKEFFPLARGLDVKKYLPFIDNTFNFDADTILEKVKKNALGGICDCKCLGFLQDIRKIIPLGFEDKAKEERIDHINKNTFRLSVSSFVDVYNFDIKSMQKECVHIITPDLKKIPFSAYNMLHRKCKS